MAIPPRLIHWGKLAVQPEYRWRHREIMRLRKIARYTPAHTYLLGERLELVDSASFLALYEELIKRQVYRFEAGKSSPLIIDGGANIGVSVIYFKRLYPKSHIIAFEPDPEVFRLLKKNCESFGIKDVETIPKALWTADTSLEFKREGSDAGRISGAEDDSDLIRVQACRLNDYLDQKIDLLKLDIEGAETEVLKDCADRMSNIERVFVEYHSFADSPQSLNDLISVLHTSGFRLHMQCPMASAQPFVKRDTYLGMDFQVNIFAFRS